MVHANSARLAADSNHPPMLTKRLASFQPVCQGNRVREDGPGRRTPHAPREVPPCAERNKHDVRPHAEREEYDVWPHAEREEYGSRLRCDAVERE
jgi:hypothetical protein